MAKKTNNNLKKKGRFWLYLILMLIVPLLCYISNFAIRRYVLSYTVWEFASGLLIVGLADMIVYVLYGNRVWVWDKKEGRAVNRIWEIISMSNVVSLLITIGILFPIYFGLCLDDRTRAVVVDTLSEMTLCSGKIIISITTISQYIPVINLGLALIAAGWIVIGFLAPHLKNCTLFSN